jgi:hypothetical protein
LTKDGVVQGDDVVVLAEIEHVVKYAVFGDAGF